MMVFIFSHKVTETAEGSSSPLLCVLCDLVAECLCIWNLDPCTSVLILG